MKKLCIVLMCTFLVGCSSSNKGSSSNGKSTGTDTKGSAKSSDVKIEDLDWKVGEGISDGDRTITFNYKNNTKYTIKDFSIKFSLKKEVTEDQLKKIMEPVLKESKNKEDVLKDFYIEGSISEICSPGKTTSKGSIDYDFGPNVNGMESYNLTEPDIATIKYLNNKKIYTLYYDFKNKKYNLDEGKTKDALEWSNTDISKKVPKPNLEIGYLINNKEDYFAFDGRGVSKSFYNDYLKQCKDKGFINDIDSTDLESFSRYEAKDSDRNELTLTWNKSGSELLIKLEKIEKKDK